MVTTGYNETLFFNLTKEEKEEFSCSICCHILRIPHQCRNGHQFCYFCIKRWTISGNHATCPMCRVDGLYKENIKLEQRINSKIVHCEWSRCFWTGPLTDLETHHHEVYFQRNKQDTYQNRRLESRKSRQSYRSTLTQSQSMTENVRLSYRLQEIEVQSHGRFEQICRRIVDCELQKLKDAERIKRRILQSERSLRHEDMRMLYRIRDSETRRRREIEENKRRAKSLELKKEQFRDTSLRKSLRHEKELKEENILLKQRIEALKKKKELEREKTMIRVKEIERIKTGRNQAFKRKLERERTEWQEKWKSILSRVQVIERKKKEKVHPIDIADSSKEEPGGNRNENVQDNKPKDGQDTILNENVTQE